MTKQDATLNFWISKQDIALIDKLAEAKGTTRSAIVREALHVLFAHHDMLPEESTRLLLGQFIHKANEAFVTSEA